MIALLPMAQSAPVKPKAGQPCNGCGVCCAEEPCHVIRDFAHVTEGPCPAMEWEAGRFYCGLIRQPSKYLGTVPEGDNPLGRQIAECLGAGRGCDSEIVGVDWSTTPHG